MENHELIKKAVKYIDQLGSTKTTIEEVAKEAGFSIDYFNRIFRNHTGFNIMEYVRFRKLNRAARMLRSSTQDILSIALDCGYESHEGFTREFKKQYKETPSEYRDHMKDKPLVWADNELNATAVSELQYYLPDFVEKDSGEIINWLLEKDAKRYGYTAITIANNGSKIVSHRDVHYSDYFVTIDNFFERPRLTLVLKNIRDLRKQIKLLLAFSPFHIDIIFHNDTSLEAVQSELNGIPYKNIGERVETMYFGEPFVIPKEAEKYSFRILEERDLDAVEAFISQHHDPVYKRSGGFGLMNLLKKPLEQRPFEQPIGVFENNKLLAISRDTPQSTSGFFLNNCISTAKLSDTPNDAVKYLYLLSTNSVIEKGYIPFEDSQFNDYARTHGDFDAFELGFEQVNTVYYIDI